MKTNLTAENTGWLLANLEGDPGKRKASEGEKIRISIANKVYVTLWLLARNCLFWFLRK
jgi:hypothetical protein